MRTRSASHFCLLDYEAVREMLEEERRQKAIRAVGLRNAVGRMFPSNANGMHV